MGNRFVRVCTSLLMLACAFLALSASMASAAPPAHLWSQRFGGTSSDGGDAVAVDASGNVLVTGEFRGTVDFGGSNLVTTGGADIFLAKYDETGVHQWSQRFGGTSHDGGDAVAVDASGNVLVTGYFQVTADFGGGGLVGAGSRDIFVAKYDPNGNHLWSHHYGSTGFDQGHGVAVDASGNVLVTGEFQGTVDFGGGNLVSAGGSDIFVAKYDANGVHQWSHRFGETSANYGYAVAGDASGNVLVTGRFSDTADFGGGNLVSAGLTDIFVVKYDANGNHLWSQRYGSTGFDKGLAVAVDASGNALVTGCFWGTVDFGGGNLVSAGGGDIFVARYDANGVHQWSRRFGDTSTDEALAAAVDASGNVLVAGGFEGTVDFGGGNLVNGGLTDIFGAKYDANGNHLWSQRLGGTSNDYAVAVAVDASGNVLLTGYFSGTVDFGGGNLVSAGPYTDIFLAKYAAGTPTAVSGPPTHYMLSMSSFPNPFNPRTTVSYTVPVPGNVTVAVYDARGVRVATLVDNEERTEGAYRTEWDGRAEGDAAVPSGVYFARIEQDGATRSKKMALLK